MKRHNHTPGTGRGRGYERDRDTQWTRNSDAIRRYIGGGFVELLINNRWVLLKPMGTIRFFHDFPARPYNGTDTSHAISLTEYED